MLPTALRNLRGALFPSNAMGSPTLLPPGTDQELRALRRRCASALWTLVPATAGRLFLGGAAAPWLARSLDLSSYPSPSCGDSWPPSPRSGPTTTNSSDSDSRGGRGSTSQDQDQGQDQERRQQQDQQQREGDGPPPADARIMAGIEAGILDVFSDPYCNKHLMYGALELILVRLVPELAEKGPVELWEQRSSG